MQLTVAPALKALLENFIDYAGIYPPASLAIDSAVTNYEQYRNGQHAWMLRWFVLGADKLSQVPDSMNGQLSVIADTDEQRAATLETKGIVKSSKPAYCEVALSNLAELDTVKASGCFAKIRTGGVKPEAIPSPADVSAFILACAERRLPFKATAGLHHPVRAEQPLTYEANAPRAVMHGFINVVMASAFAWHGEDSIEAIIAETDPAAFSFDNKATWREKSLTTDQVRDARKNFMHSIGSCSFDEPVTELRQLGLI